MAEKIVFVTELDNSKTVESLSKTEEKVIGIKQQLKALTNEMILNGDKSSEAYQKMSKEAGVLKDRIGDAQQAVKAYASDTPKLDLAASAFKTIGNTAQVAMGATALLGLENKNVTESIQKMIAVQSLMNGVQQLAKTFTEENILMLTLQDAKTKAMAISQTLYTAAVGTSTGGLKLFRLALIGTGIGAIIVGLGLLIANFDKVSAAVSGAIENFRNMGPVMKIIMFPITQLIWAFDMLMLGLQKLGIVDSEETKQMKLNAAARVVEVEKEGKAIDDKYTQEIAMAKAAGKDTYDIEVMKRQAILDTIKLKAQAILAEVKANGEYTEEQKKSIQEMMDLTIKTKNEMAVAEVEHNKKITDDNKKKNDDISKDKKAALQKSYDDAKAIADTESALKADTINKIIELENNYEDSKLGKSEKEIQDINDKYFALLEAAKKYHLDTTQLEAAQKAEIKVVEDADKVSKDETDAANKAQMDANMAEGLKDLENEAAAKKEIDDAVISQKRQGVAAIGNILSTASDAAGKETAAGKAMAVAATTISTYQTAQSAYQSAFLPVPTVASPVVGAISAAAAIAAGLMSVKNILSVKVPGKSGGGGGGGGGGSIPRPPSTSPVPQSLFATQQLPGAETEKITSGGPGSQQIIKAVVSERDITTVQNRISTYEQRAEIG